jgi:hypothetical protein
MNWSGYGNFAATKNRTWFLPSPQPRAKENLAYYLQCILIEGDEAVEVWSRFTLSGLPQF